MSTTATMPSSCATGPWRKDCLRSSWTIQHQDEGKPGMTQLMMALQSVHCELRAAAEAQLHSLAQERWPDLVALLACEVGDATKPTESRQMAALMFKNLLRWQQQDAQKRHGWRSLDPHMQMNIKKALLEGLLAPATREHGKASAQAWAALGAWDAGGEDLAGGLLCQLSCTTAGHGSGLARESILWCLAFLAEELGGRVSKQQVDSVLTAAAMCLQPLMAHRGLEEDAAAAASASAGATGGSCGAHNEPELVAASSALAAVLPLASSNFAVSHERDYLVQVILQLCTAREAALQQVGVSCLRAACDHHLEALQPRAEAVAVASLRCLQSHGTDEEALLLLLDLWTSLCDEDHRRGPGSVDGIAAVGAQLLLPALLERLLFQTDIDVEADEDDDCGAEVPATWLCLAALARTLRGGAFPLCAEFAEAHRASASWRQREAAAVATGAAAAGLRGELLVQAVSGGVPALLGGCAQDPSPRVQRSRIWAVGMMIMSIQQFPEAQLNDGDASRIVDGLRKAVRSGAPMVAEMACAALVSLIGGLPASAAAAHFSPVVGALLGRAEGAPASSKAAGLQMAVFAAVQDVVRVAPGNCCPMMADLAAVIGRQVREGCRRVALLSASCSTASLSRYLKHLRELQASLCDVLQSLLARLGQEASPQLRGRLPCCDELAHTLGMVEAQGGEAAGEALEALAALGVLWGPPWPPALEEALWRPLHTALRSSRDWQGCLRAAGLLQRLYAQRPGPLGLLPGRHGLVLECLEEHLLLRGALGSRLGASCLSLLGTVAAAAARHGGGAPSPGLLKSLALLSSVAEVWLEQHRQRPAQERQPSELRQLQLGILRAYADVLQGLTEGASNISTISGGRRINCSLTEQQASVLVAVLEVTCSRLLLQQHQQQGYRDLSEGKADGERQGQGQVEEGGHIPSEYHPRLEAAAAALGLLGAALSCGASRRLLMPSSALQHQQHQNQPEGPPSWLPAFLQACAADPNLRGPVAAVQRAAAAPEQPYEHLH